MGSSAQNKYKIISGINNYTIAYLYRMVLLNLLYIQLTNLPTLNCNWNLYQHYILGNPKTLTLVHGPLLRARLTDHPKDTLSQPPKIE